MAGRPIVAAGQCHDSEHQSTGTAIVSTAGRSTQHPGCKTAAHMFYRWLGGMLTFSPASCGCPALRWISPTPNSRLNNARLLCAPGSLFAAAAPLDSLRQCYLLHITLWGVQSSPTSRCWCQAGHNILISAPDRDPLDSARGAQRSIGSRGLHRHETGFV